MIDSSIGLMNFKTLKYALRHDGKNTLLYGSTYNGTMFRNERYRVENQGRNCTDRADASIATQFSGKVVRP